MDVTFAFASVVPTIGIFKISIVENSLILFPISLQFACGYKHTIIAFKEGEHTHKCIM